MFLCIIYSFIECIIGERCAPIPNTSMKKSSSKQNQNLFLFFGNATKEGFWWSLPSGKREEKRIILKSNLFSNQSHLESQRHSENIDWIKIRFSIFLLRPYFLPPKVPRLRLKLLAWDIRETGNDVIHSKNDARGSSRFDSRQRFC